jgi:uncharacterized membrane protein
LLVLTLSWSAALVAAPAVSSVGAAGATTSALVYAAGSLICHQNPSRSFQSNGAKLPVCARCLGLYVGGAVGVIGWMVIAGLGTRPRARSAQWSSRVRAVIIATALPTLVTVATAWLGWWDPANGVRALLAVPLGAAAGAVVAAVAARDLE